MVSSSFLSHPYGRLRRGVPSRRGYTSSRQAYKTKRFKKFPRHNRVYRRGVDAHSGSHLLATFGEATARIPAFPHFTYPLTIRGALFADLGALATGEFV
jgi:hypothetical protein